MVDQPKKVANIFYLPLDVKMFRCKGDGSGKIRKNATTLILRAGNIKTRGKSNANSEKTNSTRERGVQLDQKDSLVEAQFELQSIRDSMI